MKKELIINIVSMAISFILVVIAWILSKDGDNLLTIVLWGLAFIIGARAKAIEGVKDTIENKNLNVEILMILSALGAFAIANYREGAVLILIFGISGVLEEYSMAKSEKALTALLNLAPETALLIKDDREQEVEVDSLQLGDHVLVKVGAQVPTDGKIISGATTMNQSALTGEFLGVAKKEGDEVLSGSINEEATVSVEVTKLPSESMVQKIVKFVSNAQEEKTPTQTWIESFEEKYVYVVLFLSIAMMIVPALLNIWTWKESFYRGIVLLVVASPCALVASISPTMLATMSHAARKGILVKGSIPIEILSKIGAVVMDKTGTITKGKPQVEEIVLKDESLLPLILEAEKQSSHPLAEAIVDYLESQGIVSDHRIETSEQPGKGVSFRHDNQEYHIGRFDYQQDNEVYTQLEASKKEGYTTSSILKNNELIGYIKLKDTVRENIRETIDYLNDEEIVSVMLTGDNQHSADMIASLVGITKAVGNCFPEDKVNEIKTLQKDHKVAMVGDGINDSPALATADVGLAMGGGTDVTLETADVVFMNDNLSNLQTIISLSKKGQRIALENVIFSISVIILLILANVFQVIQLPLAVVFHEGSTILVILNGLRMLK